MPTGKQRKKRHHRQREEQGIRFRTETALDEQIAQTPPWSNILQFADQVAVPRVVDMLGELLTFRHTEPDRLEIFAERNGPANTTLTKMPDGTLEYRVTDKPPEQRRDLNTIVETTLRRFKNEVANAIHFQIQSHSTARQHNLFQEDIITRKGMAGYILRLTTEAATAQILRKCQIGKRRYESSSRTMGEQIRPIIRDHFSNAETIELVEQYVPKPPYRQRNPPPVSCTIIQYNAMTLAADALHDFREITPLGAAYYWKVMLQRETIPPTHRSIPELERTVRQHIGLDQDEWDFFRGLDVYSTYQHIWHRDQNWFQVGTRTLISIDQPIQCYWLRSYLFTAQELHQRVAEELTPSWNNFLRTTAWEHDSKYSNCPPYKTALHREIEASIEAKFEKLTGMPARPNPKTGAETQAEK